MLNLVLRGRVLEHLSCNRPLQMLDRIHNARRAVLVLDLIEEGHCLLVESLVSDLGVEKCELAGMDIQYHVPLLLRSEELIHELAELLAQGVRSSVGHGAVLRRLCKIILTPFSKFTG